jgi:hypothetical protein
MRAVIVGTVFGLSAATVGSLATGLPPWFSASATLAALVFWAGYEVGHRARAQSST